MIKHETHFCAKANFSAVILSLAGILQLKQIKYVSVLKTESLSEFDSSKAFLKNQCFCNAWKRKHFGLVLLKHAKCFLKEATS